ncbi:MAG: hypothetical protein AB7S41_09010 [Parvibaculaceae bacterium]
MSLDDLRAAYPKLAFALYALTPGGAVTLEVIDEAGEIFDFKGETAAAAMAAAFPDVLPAVPDLPEPIAEPANVFE